MAEPNDIALLREYLDRNSETAFAELVNRHINLVYSVALRNAGNSHDAQDVTQAVFVILAKKAKDLRHRNNLTGWLYETARFTCRQLLRTRARQQAREHEAYMQSTLNDLETDSLWRQLMPLLEEAMSRLSEKERALVALRYFENRSVADTAAALGIQEWAARKRDERAMEKLRVHFSRRGVTLTTGTIAGAISANSVQAAPIGLTKTISAVAIAKGAAASGSTLTLIKGALKLMAWTKAKTAIVVGVAAILIVGTTTLIVHRNHQAIAQTDFPRSSWKNAGNADPVSAFETAFWASSQNDGKTLLASLSPDLQQKLGLNLTRAGISPEEFLSQDQNSASHINGVTGFHVIKLEAISDNEARLHLSIEGKQGEKIFKMKKIGDEWKMDDFPTGF